MSVQEKMTAIANAIREKTGKTATLTLDDMATEIANLTPGAEGKEESLILPSNIPSYVRDEAQAIIQKVRAVQTEDSIVFLAMSDSHYYGDQIDFWTDDQNITHETRYSDGIQTNESVEHAAMAAKILAYSLNFDFMAHLGDASWSSNTTTPETGKAQINNVFKYLKESHESLPCFHAIGNHDTGTYYQEKLEPGGNQYLHSGNYLYNAFTKLSDSENTVISGASVGGYCYRDFPDKKLRVFLINTSESLITNSNDYSVTSNTQRQWLADALLNLNAKPDADRWGFIILSHYPADYGSTMPLSELLKVYVEGATISIGNVQKNFQNNNSAKFIAQFHGHIHNFIASKLYSYATGAAIQYDGWRISVPNGQFNRENYYNVVGNYTGISFKEEKTYPKTKQSGKDTSFVINVVNPSTETIYSFCYGAGYDRVIGYGETIYYTITTNLTNTTISNNTLSVEAGASFDATLIPADHCSLNSVSVFENQTNITDKVYSDKKIHIDAINGNINIIAVSKVAWGCTNQMPISTDLDGSIYNGKGYKASTYISGSGLVGSGNLWTTGFIPVKIGDIIRMRDFGYCNDTKAHIVFYDQNRTFIHQINGDSTYPLGLLGAKLDPETQYRWTELTLNNTIYPEGWSSERILAYVRFQLAEEPTEWSIITVNEEIKYADEDSPDIITYSITYDLKNVTCNNTQASIVANNSYNATLGTNTNYVITEISILMGGIDITNLVYDNGTIIIPNVTGELVITAAASYSENIAYTNQLPISTDTEGKVFNGVGYKENTYLSSGNEGTRDGSYISGFIPVNGGDTVYFKNCTINAENNYHRFSAYDSNKTLIANHTQNTTSSQIAKIGVPTYDENGNMTSLTISGSYWSSVKYLRFCCSYLGSDSIVTINQKID